MEGNEQNLPKERSATEIAKKGYSDEEVASIFQLARLFAENGNVRQSEVLALGLNETAPEFAPAWLLRSYLHIQDKDFDKAVFAARQALRIDPNMVEALVFLVSCFLTLGDFHSAGTHLGEIGERIDGGSVNDSRISRLYESQLVRFQNR